MNGEVPLRRSLLVRLLAASVLIAVCAVTATAWLATRTTTRAIHQQQSQALSDDTAIYQALTDYAATHSGWSGVAGTVTRLAAHTGRGIVLTTQDRSRVLAGPASTVRGLPARESAVVDPLHVDSTLMADPHKDGIDTRAVGPFALPAAERSRLAGVAGKELACLRRYGYPARSVTQPTGRPTLVIEGGLIYTKGRELCSGYGLDNLTTGEQRAAEQLGGLARPCLERHHVTHVKVLGPYTVQGADSAQAQQCVDDARREQLAPYTAPAALLFVSTPADTSTGPVFDLTPANTARIAGVAGLVLAVTVAVTVLLGVRLVRPLRQLTAVALRGPGTGPSRVAVTTRDEIGRLTAAFNDLAERREQLDEQRKTMVSDVAHELRTPLANIRSWLEAAEDGLATSDDALIAFLLQEARQLQHLVDDLQDLASADAGALHLRPEPVELHGLLERVRVTSAAGAHRAGIRMAVEAPAGLWVAADPVRLQQAVVNLVSNALRHTPAGGTVTLRGCGDGAEAVVDVADTGVGLTPEQLSRVFDRFWRADPSRSRATGGSGLGLAIVRKLAEAHGGTVTAASVPGAGATFTLRLPMTPRAGVAKEAARRPGAQ